MKRLITVVVRFRPRAFARAAAREVFEQAIPASEQVPGLLRRYYLAGDGPGSGLYFWADRQAAERYYSAAWRRELETRFGVEPEVLFIERAVEDSC
jgi:quinol monooxygenase YgiN